MDMDKESKSAAPAVVRAARILDLLAQASEPVTLAALARELQLPKSSLHALCGTLLDLRMIARDENGSMSLGPHVMSWANAFLAKSDDIVQSFYGALQDVKTLPEETITLAIHDGDSVVYVTSRKGTRAIGISFRPGMRVPAAYSSTGKAILSTHPDDTVRAIFSKAWPKPLTSGGVADVNALLKQLRGVRTRGYSIDDGEIREGLFCVGAPVFDTSDGPAVAGVAVSFLSSQVDKSLEADAGQAMRALADKLSQRLGAVR